MVMGGKLDSVEWLCVIAVGENGSQLGLACMAGAIFRKDLQVGRDE